MENIILTKIQECTTRGERAALVTLTSGIGSTPRKTGSLMAVCVNREIYGSVGGGKVELTIINKAIECIENGEDYEFEYKLNENGLGMECGGQVKGFIKIFKPKIKLIIVGAGHIGQKLNAVAKVLNMHTVIFDDREEYANRERFADADEIIVGDLDETLANYKVTKEDNVTIVTKGHIADKQAMKIMALKDVAYIGMIGSRRKITTIMNEAIEEGIPKERLMQIYAPMGLDVGARLPEEIAVGILSEILLIKNKGSLNHMKNLKGMRH